jgi:hypothetical protein
METPQSEIAHNPISPEYRQGLLDAFEAVAAAEARSPLYGDEEEENESDKVAKAVVGTEGLLPTSEPSKRVSVAKYDVSMREHMAEIVNKGDVGDQGKKVENPRGHVDFGFRQGNASFSGVVYVTETGSIVGLFEGSVGVTDPLSDSSKAVADFAAEMGFGDVWTNNLYQTERTEQQTHRYVVDLNAHQVVGLTEQLKNFT